jgi:hypothetical protein
MSYDVYFCRDLSEDILKGLSQRLPYYSILKMVFSLANKYKANDPVAIDFFYRVFENKTLRENTIQRLLDLK